MGARQCALPPPLTAAHDGQHAVLDTRLHLIRIDRMRHAQGAPEFAERPLDEMIILLVFLLLHPLLAANGEHVVVERDVDILFRHARQFGRDPHFVFGFRDVHLRHDHAVLFTLADRRRHAGAEHVVKQPVHAPLQRHKGIAAHQAGSGRNERMPCHGLASCYAESGPSDHSFPVPGRPEADRKSTNGANG